MPPKQCSGCCWAVLARCHGFLSVHTQKHKARRLRVGKRLEEDNLHSWLMLHMMSCSAIKSQGKEEKFFLNMFPYNLKHILKGLHFPKLQSEKLFTDFILLCVIVWIIFSWIPRVIEERKAFMLIQINFSGLCCNILFSEFLHRLYIYI